MFASKSIVKRSYKGGTGSRATFGSTRTGLKTQESEVVADASASQFLQTKGPFSGFQTARVCSDPHFQTPPATLTSRVPLPTSQNKASAFYRAKDTKKENNINVETLLFQQKFRDRLQLRPDLSSHVGEGYSHQMSETTSRVEPPKAIKPFKLNTMSSNTTRVDTRNASTQRIGCDEFVSSLEQKGHSLNGPNSPKSTKQ